MYLGSEPAWTTEAAPSGLHKTPLSRKVVPGSNPICRLCWFDAGGPATDLSEVADHALPGITRASPGIVGPQIT